MKGGIIERLGVSPEKRRSLYYLVCVPLRIMIAVGIVYAPRWLVAIGSAASVIMNAVGILSEQDVWWSRKLHLMSAAMVLALTTLQQSKSIIAVVAMVDVIVGASSSFFIADALS